MSKAVESSIARAAAHWNNVLPGTRPARSSWWESQKIIHHINERVCGEAIPGAFAGFHRLLEACKSKGPLETAISVGCGSGLKEMSLLARGVVGHFALVEISEARIEQGMARAKAMNLLDRVQYLRNENYLAIQDPYDLTYWNNSLHHMPDTRAAIKWSLQRLPASGGVFAMDDFIGPSRFQWTDNAMALANSFLATLPEEVFQTNGTQHARRVKRPSVEGMIRMDPSEAADSSSIVPAIMEFCPGAEIRYTGGAIYHIGLNYILANIPEDSWWLDEALRLDDLASKHGENHYAVAVFDTR